VENLIGGGGLDSVTESKHETVAKSVESVTESTNPDSEKLSRIREALVRWRGKVSDKRGPRWDHVHELLDELEFVEFVTESSEKL
jgi:hypothetical protein